MRALGKKLGALGLVLLMAVGTVACGDSSQTQAESTETAAGTTIAAQTDAAGTEAATTAAPTTAAELNADGEKAVITVDGKEIPFSVASYYVDQTKNTYEYYFSSYNNGQEMNQSEWYQTVPGKEITYAEDLQESCKDFLISGIVVSGHAEEYGVALSEADETTIQTQADQLMQTIDPEKIASFGLTKEHLVDFLRYNTLSNQIYGKVTDAFTCEVSDEESRTVSYQIFALSTKGAATGGDDLPTMEEAKEKAKAVLSKIQSGEDAAEAVKELGTTVIDDTISVGQFEDSDEIASKVLSMKTGDVLVHEDAEGFTLYGVYCVSDDDAEGREARKEEIRLQKADDSFDGLMKQWQTESEILVDETLWDQINIFES